LIKKYKNILKTSLYYYLNSVFTFIQLYLIYLVTNNSTINGLWLTILSIATLIAVLDFGLGNTLRNIIGKLKVGDNHEKISVYFSTGIFSFSIMFILIMIIFISLNRIVDYNILFNIPTSILGKNEFKTLILIIVLLNMLKVFFNIFNAIYDANSLNYISSKILFLGNIISCTLLITQFLFKFKSLLLMSFIIFLPSIIISILYYIGFVKKHTIYMFNFKYVKLNKKVITDIYSVGLDFFILQFLYLILFSSSSIIISNLLDPSMVVEYQYIFKVFSIVTLGFNAVLSPFWTSIVNNFSVKDVNSIKNNNNKIKKLYFYLVVLSIVISFILPFILGIIFTDINFKFTTTLSILLFIVIYMWTNMYQTICNGLGIIKIQIVVYLVAVVISISLSIILINSFSFGSEAVAIASIIALLPASIILPFVVRKKLVEL